MKPLVPQSGETFVGILLGAPGSGKGTQGGALARRLGVPILSTGDMLRSEIAAGTSLGRHVGQMMAMGALVTDEIVNDLAAHRIARPDCRSGFLLDGFPRSVAQARFLDGLLTGSRFPEPLILHLYVPVEDLKTRLGGRRICPRCNHPFHIAQLKVEECCPFDGAGLVTRPDDRMEAVESRLGLYSKYEAELIQYYGSRNYRGIDGTGSVDSVAERISAIVGSLVLAAA